MTSQGRQDGRFDLPVLVGLGVGILIMGILVVLWRPFNEGPSQRISGSSDAREAVCWTQQRLEETFSRLEIPAQRITTLDVRTRRWEGQQWEMRILRISVSRRVEMDRIVEGLEEIGRDPVRRVGILWTIREEEFRAADLWVDDFLTHRIFIQRHPRELRPPPRPVGAQLALILDDIGNVYRPIKEVLNWGIPLTLSVFPKRPYSRRIAREASLRGLEVMLHLPMEPWGYPEKDPGAGALMHWMSSSEMKRVLEEDLRGLPRVRGVNNHMGSRFTEDRRAMQEVLSVLKERRLYFVDSLTTPRSVGYRLAREMGVPSYRRDVFLDVVPRKEAIRGQFQKFLQVASLQGFAVGIAHPYPETLQLLPELFRSSSLAGYRWISVSSLGPRAARIERRSPGQRLGTESAK